MKPRISHVIVIAVAALVLVSGGGVAGAFAGAKWINGKDIKPNSIPANRIKTVDSRDLRGKIAGNKITERSIAGSQLAAETITTDELSDETVDQLQPSVEYVERVITVNQHITSPTYALVPAVCPAGEQAVAGYVHGERTAIYDPGYDYVDTATGAFMVRIFSPDNGVETSAHVQVMCLKPAPATTTP